MKHVPMYSSDIVYFRVRSSFCFQFTWPYGALIKYIRGS